MIDDSSGIQSSAAPSKTTTILRRLLEIMAERSDSFLCAVRTYCILRLFCFLVQE